MISKQRIYKVYWIRLQEHTNILEQGYVGITKHSIYYRFGQHIHSNRPVGHILREIEEEALVIEEIFRGTKEEALEKEYELRSNRYTGWNIMAGGNKATRTCKVCGVHLAKASAGEVYCTVHNSKESKQYTKGNTPWNSGLGEKYILTSPSGEEYTPRVFTKFCRENNLTAQNLRKVSKGLRKHHKGWIAKKIH